MRRMGSFEKTSRMLSRRQSDPGTHYQPHSPNRTRSLGDESVESLALEYLGWDTNEQTRDYIQDLMTNQNISELKELLCKRLTFGTSGLRAPMGPGYARMNELVIIQTTQGVCAYLKKCGLGQGGVVIGYDHRTRRSLTSKRFAQLAACVFVEANIPVLLYGEMVVTPLVPFGIEYKDCDAGIMITASHNPKEDNGYKLYWKNGCQIIPPHDDNIAACILQNLAPWKTYSTKHLHGNALVSDPWGDITTAYYTQMAASYCRYPTENQEGGIDIAYTPMHGVGHVYAAHAFEAFGLPPYEAVQEQKEPDASFPTVPFPNPEEGEGALKLAFETADRNHCTLILANDPDGDRLAVAEFIPESRKWKVFTGNEIGVLLGYWEWCQFKKSNPDFDFKKVYMVASTVSSKMLKAIAHEQGFQFVETLTGFKWMGNKSDELRKAGNTVLFSFEESIGYCVGDLLKDKDGICAAALFAEMALMLHRTKGITIFEQLTELYEKYGRFVTHNDYIVCQDPELTLRIFKRLRNKGKYWKKCGQYDIAHVRDQTTGFDSSAVDLRTTLPVTPSVQMITYTFENDCVVTMRTSGTEPKIKYYVEYRAEGNTSPKVVQKELDIFVNVIVSEMLQPTEISWQ